MMAVLPAIAAWTVVGLAGEGAVHEFVEYYDISGATARQLRSALNRSGPVAANGRRYDGLTVWNIAWYPELRSSDESCELVAFETSVDAAVTLPRWTDESGAPHDLVEQWNEYSRALAAHERGHGEIAVRAASAMRERVESLPARTTCAELEEDVGAAVGEVLKAARREERRYDRKTRHGKAEGARFP